jgi:crossover junction endodeoxyribonuclease RuvC
MSAITFIGIDPGVTGAIASIKDGAVKYAKFGREAALIYRAFMEVNITPISSFACIEKVASRPAQGVKSVFTFGKATGMALGILYSQGISYREISPAKWMNALIDADLRGLGKEKSVHMVHRLYPSLHLTKTQHNIADAILIATYARSVYAP